MKLWMSADGSDGNGIRYCMENDKGVLVEVCTMGASITKIVIPDKNRRRDNIVARLADPAAYRKNGLYAGATVAPTAGRIAKGAFSIGEQAYQVSCNENGNCLHGGFTNASFQEWTLLQVAEFADKAVVAMTLRMPDGLDGFPGNRTFYATYTLEAGACLRVSYRAITDKDTYVNMTNHTYFNMEGTFDRSAENQVLTVVADHYLAMDETKIPTHKVAVKGTVMDFSRGRRISDVLGGGLPEGLDHCFDVHKAAKDGKRVAELFSLAKGRGVRIKSKTAQGVVVYSGGGIGGLYQLEGTDGVVTSADFGAVAMECQAFPDAVNRPDFQPEILKPGQVYRHEMSYEFLF